MSIVLQGEVDQWEDKVKSLKEELSQLETQKKGLEAILRKHSGKCKVVKSEGEDIFQMIRKDIIMTYFQLTNRNQN